MRVETNDPMAQIVVLNDRFSAVFTAAGSGAVTLPSGIYKVRVQRGTSSIGFEDRLVVLDRDCTISIEPPKLYSPAPIGGTRASDAHVAAREWLDGVVHVERGVGSKIALLARYAAPRQGKKPLIHPFQGLELFGPDGRLLVDLEQAIPKYNVPSKDDPVSVCGIAVSPGAYVLRHRLSTGRHLAQSVVASSGWQITLNIRRSQQDVVSAKKLFAQPGYVAVLMRRLIDSRSADHAPMRLTKDGPIDEDQLVDVARQGLASRAQLLSGNLYDLLLRDFENPLVGIVGSLLLDLEREMVGEGLAELGARRILRRRGCQASYDGWARASGRGGPVVPLPGLPARSPGRDRRTPDVSSQLAHDPGGGFETAQSRTPRPVEENDRFRLHAALPHLVGGDLRQASQLSPTEENGLEFVGSASCWAQAAGEPRGELVRR